MTFKLPFLQERSFIFCRDTVISSKSVSDAIYPKNRPCFRMKVRYIYETGFAILKKNIQSPLLKKWQTSLDASRKKANRTLRRAGPILPLLVLRHACEGAETSIFGFQKKNIIRDDLMLLFVVNVLKGAIFSENRQKSEQNAPRQNKMRKRPGHM